MLTSFTNNPTPCCNVYTDLRIKYKQILQLPTSETWAGCWNCRRIPVIGQSSGTIANRFKIMLLEPRNWTLENPKHQKHQLATPAITTMSSDSTGLLLQCHSSTDTEESDHPFIQKAPLEAFCNTLQDSNMHQWCQLQLGKQRLLSLAQQASSTNPTSTVLVTFKKYSSWT